MVHTSGKHGEVSMKDLQLKVERILEQCPQARNDDRELIRIFYARMGKQNITIEQWCMNKTLPSFDSITRARRKVTQYRKDLRGIDKVEQGRYEKQREYIEWATTD